MSFFQWSSRPYTSIPLPHWKKSTLHKFFYNHPTPLRPWKKAFYNNHHPRRKPSYRLLWLIQASIFGLKTVPMFECVWREWPAPLPPSSFDLVLCTPKKNGTLWKKVDSLWLDQCKFIPSTSLMSLVFCMTLLRLHDRLHPPRHWFIQFIVVVVYHASPDLFVDG